MNKKIGKTDAVFIELIRGLSETITFEREDSQPHKSMADNLEKAVQKFELDLRGEDEPF